MTGTRTSSHAVPPCSSHVEIGGTPITTDIGVDALGYADQLDQAVAAATSDRNSNCVLALDFVEGLIAHLRAQSTSTQQLVDIQSAPAPDDVREAVARAIEDAEVGYCIKLVSLIDGVATYALDYADGGETLAFGSHADAADHVASRRALMRADAAIAAMRGRP